MLMVLGPILAIVLLLRVAKNRAVKASDEHADPSEQD
jgi:hypothetical protein